MVELLGVAREMSKTAPAVDYKRELESLKRIEATQSNKSLTKLFGR